MAHSTRRQSAVKPAKPFDGFPLFAHANGRWAKKVRGKFAYFGKWSDDPAGTAALALWEARKDDLLAGRVSSATREPKGPTVADVASAFLVAKEGMVETGEIARRTWTDYHTTCARIVATLGKERPVADLGPADFLRLKNKMAKTMGLVSLGVEIARTRHVFRWAADEDTRLIDHAPQFGREFRPPSRKAIARAKQSNGQAARMFEAHEIRAMIDAAGVHFRPLILLGVNCGFGNMDVATLTHDALDMEGGWANHPRPKTGVERRCPLWPETIEAIRKALENKRKPAKRAFSNLVFLTQMGRPWVRLDKKRGSDGWQDASWSDSVGVVMHELLVKLGLNRKGRGFYALRHVFETVGGESLDQVAVDAIMGHVTPGMGSTYRERISDERLRRVTDFVRAWVFAEPSDREG
ncbi:MAG TPA: hypothetical protein VMY37_28715 [Thermoguttaceae bacterium]|nr:hypothetical protein [Thermoguttaceae bacterium]